MGKVGRATLVAKHGTGIAVLVLLTSCVQFCDLVLAEENPSAEQVSGNSSENRSELRKFSPVLDGNWIGQGISYGPYREGQAPGGNSPSTEELSEDLQLLAKHWKLIRIYGSDDVAEDILQIIHHDELPIKVMLGAWITGETESETLDAYRANIAKQANRRQVTTAIRLANSFPDEVAAISVGNETQVYWSDHLTKPEILIQYIREVREATSVPVTTADDFNFWNKPESKLVATELDFIVTHIYAMWAGLLPETAMQWTKRIFAEVSAFHPEKTIVIGEAGWATQVHDQGEQAELIKGEASEASQQLYYKQFTAWAAEERICTFFFEAFDEPWKGGSHPNEVEKNWGLFFLDRTPKAAMSDSK